MGKKYKRIEVIGYRDSNNEGGAGVHLGVQMNVHGLNATPFEVRWKHQHWFTPLGFEAVGKKLVEYAKENDIPIRIRENTFATIKGKTITYEDTLQVTVKKFKKAKI